MDLKKREALLARVLAGYLRCRIDGEVILVKNPTLDVKYEAEDIYNEALVDSYYKGMMNDDELLIHLMNIEHWTLKDEEELLKLQPNIEDLKVKLYQSSFKSETRRQTKEDLKTLKDRLDTLYSKRHSLDHTTSSGYAQLARIRFMIANSLFDVNGRQILLDKDGTKLDRVIEAVSEHRIGEPQYRELARTEPWRPYWAIGKGDIGIAPIYMSEEQKTLCSWSKVYDSVYENPQFPGDNVVEDDDCLDGWFILQRRKREQNNLAQEADELISNEKIKNSKEVFIVVENEEDAKKVEQLNTNYAKMIKQQKEKAIANKNEVLEQHMPFFQSEM